MRPPEGPERPMGWQEVSLYMEEEACELEGGQFYRKKTTSVRISTSLTTHVA